jgi:hypothetical protein
MDNIKFRNKFVAMKTPQRNQFIMDTIAWLESDERPKCKSEHLSHLVNFENELQQRLNEANISETWFTTVAQTYGSFPFYAAFIRRVL